MLFGDFRDWLNQQQEDLKLSLYLDDEHTQTDAIVDTAFNKIKNELHMLEKDALSCRGIYYD